MSIHSFAWLKNQYFRTPMKIVEALKENKKEILSVWIDRTLDSYASSSFFKTSEDKFANPVGANITHGLTSLFNLLVAGVDRGEYYKPLDQVIRIRAIQEFTPAQAIASDT